MGNKLSKREEMKNFLCKDVKTKMGNINLKQLNKTDLILLNSLIHYLYEKDFYCEINEEIRVYKGLMNLKYYIDGYLNSLNKESSYILQRTTYYMFNINEKTYLTIDFNLDENYDDKNNIEIINIIFGFLFNYELNSIDYFENEPDKEAIKKMRKIYEKYLENYMMDMTDIDKISYYYILAANLA